jgi:hypothetical protein
MKPKTLLPVLVVSLLGVPVLAADIPYTGQQTRAIKALSDDEIAALLKGEGMGMAKAAELNGYPGPAHVLALTEQLGLTNSQQRNVRKIFERMSAAAKPLGAELIKKEQTLDHLFANSEITPDRPFVGDGCYRRASRSPARGASRRASRNPCITRAGPNSPVSAASGLQRSGFSGTLSLSSRIGRGGVLHIVFDIVSETLWFVA